MRVQIKSEGGLAAFPGLSRPLSFDSADLSADDAASLSQLVEAANFFDLPARVGDPPPGAADYRQLDVTIEDAGRSHSVVITDFATDPPVLALRDYLRAKQRSLRGG